MIQFIRKSLYFYLQRDEIYHVKIFNIIFLVNLNEKKPLKCWWPLIEPQVIKNQQAII